jgi:hypothetical protein
MTHWPPPSPYPPHFPRDTDLRIAMAGAFCPLRFPVHYTHVPFNGSKCMLLSFFSLGAWYLSLPVIHNFLISVLPSLVHMSALMSGIGSPSLGPEVSSDFWYQPFLAWSSGSQGSGYSILAFLFPRRLHLWLKAFLFFPLRSFFLPTGHKESSFLWSVLYKSLPSKICTLRSNCFNKYSVPAYILDSSFLLSRFPSLHSTISSPNSRVLLTYHTLHLQ